MNNTELVTLPEKATLLLKYLNELSDPCRLDSQTVDDWRHEHIFDSAKIETNITGTKSIAQFALVFDDGFLYDLFYLFRDQISVWAKNNGLSIEQYNSWNCLFYEEVTNIE